LKISFLFVLIARNVSTALPGVNTFFMLRLRCAQPRLPARALHRGNETG
jgi:hypothetical protein